MNRVLHLFWIVCLWISVFAPQCKAEEGIAVLQVLDKVTTRISEIHAPIGVTVAFGTLRFIVRSCHQNAPVDPPEAKVFLQIWENKKRRDSLLIFSGWMFASSPSSSALEHPVYDLWPLRCESGS